MIFKNLENPIFRAMAHIYDLIVLNVLWIICSIPIITIGAATSALYYSLLKISRGMESSTAGMFFWSFKENLRQGSVLTIIFLVSGLILFVDIRTCAKMEGVFGHMAVVVLLSLVILWIMVLSYAFPILAQFENTICGTLKNAFLMSLKYWNKTVLIVLLNMVLPAVVLFFTRFFIIGIPIWIAVGISGITNLNTLMFVKIFDCYISSTE